MADAAANPSTTAETKLEEASTRPTDADTSMTDAPVDAHAGAGGEVAPEKGEGHPGEHTWQGHRDYALTN
jgi:hypothetical protein